MTTRNGCFFAQLLANEKEMPALDTKLPLSLRPSLCPFTPHQPKPTPEPVNPQLHNALQLQTHAAKRARAASGRAKGEGSGWQGN